MKVKMNKNNKLFMMNKGFILAFLLPTFFVVFSSCKETNPHKMLTSEYLAETYVSHPDWTESAVLYEVNIRQYTPEGTLYAFQQHLPRLQSLGVDVLWLMPVFPVGEMHRKAGQDKLIHEIEDPKEREKIMGSYYSTKDYFSVNPDMGTLDDLKALVEEAHKLGMRVILDIATNHTAWDHPWVSEHPQYYTRVKTGETPWNPDWMAQHPEFYESIMSLGMTYPIDPGETDWWDTADLNYENEDLRKEMKNVLKYWVEVADIDGYRCDMAGMVPCDFWNNIRTSLDSIKPVFMLAEDEENYCLMEHAFNSNYRWELHHLMNSVAQGDKSAEDIRKYFLKEDSIFDPAIYRMNFITNHDENAWKGPEIERMGDATEVFAMLTFTLPGIPLLYSGQEIGLDRRLTFFTKDEIVWKESKWEGFYRKLISLQKENEALWNGNYGGEMNMFETTALKNVLAFSRLKGENEVFVFANLGNETVSLPAPNTIDLNKYKTALGDNNDETGKEIVLEAYKYVVLVRDNVY